MPDSERYTVRSVSRAIELLEFLGEHATSDGMSVTEIAEVLGMSKSAAFATLQTLRAHGFVADDGEGQSRRYRLGIALARLGEQARNQLSLRDLARPVLRELANEIGLPARLAVLEGDHAVVVDQFDPPKRIQVDLRMGLREQLYNTGLGKALLASMAESDARAALRGVDLVAETPYTITETDQLMAHLEEVRRVGYAVDDEESVEGIFCIGSVVRDAAGRPVAAISVTSLKVGAATRRYQDLGRTTRDAAEAISARLGWRAAG